MSPGYILSATKCDLVILSVSCSSHIGSTWFTILIKEENKYRNVCVYKYIHIYIICIHIIYIYNIHKYIHITYVGIQNRRVKGGRSKEAIRQISTEIKFGILYL